MVIKKSDDFNSFYNILKKNLKSRHNVSPTHTVDELLRLNKLFNKDIVLYGAFLEDLMIGGVVNFATNEDVILSFYISHDEE